METESTKSDKPGTRAARNNTIYDPQQHGSEEELEFSSALEESSFFFFIGFSQQIKSQASQGQGSLTSTTRPHPSQQ